MTAPRRVLFLTDIFGGVHGGTEGQLVALLENLPPTWEAELWVLQDSEYLGLHPFPCPWRVLHMPRTRNPLFLPRLRSLATAIRGAGFDLIHALHADTCTLAPLLGRWAQVPVLTSRRDLGYWQTPRRIEGLRRANRHLAGILTNSAAVARRTADVEYAHPSRVHVVRNGHPAARFDAPADPELRGLLGIPDEAPLIGLVANFRPLKRQRDLVDALNALGDRAADAHVLFVGTGPGSESMVPYAESIGLAGRVHVHGVTGDVVPVLKHLDIGVLCSESEGLSNAIIEYLGCGLPVVATDVGGNAELVTPDENGFLYEVGDVDGLATHIGQLLEDAERASAMGQASRARFENEFTIDRMVAQTVSLYDELLVPPAPRDLTWRVATELSALEDLAGDWKALCGPDQFFASPSWVLTWLKWSGATPRVLVAHDTDGALVGVLPLAESRAGRFEFAGQSMGADHLDVVAAEGRAVDVARGALEHLATLRWRRLDLWHVAEDGALRHALHEPTRPVRFDERFSTRCPYIATEGLDWNTYLGTVFSRKRRHELRRTMRRFFELPGAAVSHVRESTEVEPAIERLFGLHAERFEAQGKSTVFRGERLKAFHRALGERLLRDDELFLAFLRTDERELAAYYGFVFGDKLYHFQSGIAHVERGTSPGNILRNHVLEHDIFGAGLAEFDFLDGDEPYKFQWATGQRRLFDITVRPRTISGGVGTTAGELTRLLKSEVKRRRAKATTET